MSELEAYQAKQRFLKAAEDKIRRRLSEMEKRLLTKIFENVIDSFEMKDGVVPRNAANTALLDKLGQVFQDFMRTDMVKTVEIFASDLLTTKDLNLAYFRLIDGVQAAALKRASEAGDRYLRNTFGIKTDGSLKASGFLQEVIEDNTVRQKVRQAISRSIDEGGRMALIRSRVREVVTGKDGKAGELSKKWERDVLDTLQEGSAATEQAIAVEVGLLGAIWQGGLIKNTRKFCCQLDGKAWTREELDTLGQRDWSGKKPGSIFINRGGYGCRHGLRWIGTARILRMRPDLELKDGKLVSTTGAMQPFNSGCEKRA